MRPLRIDYPTTAVERTVNAARLRCALIGHSLSSVYLEHQLSGLTIRIADHPRHRHHRASYECDAADVTILILSPGTAVQFEVLAAADRFWIRPDAIIIRRPGERYAITAQRLRARLATCIRYNRQ